MKTFCFGCGKVRQADGSWKEEEYNKKTDSSTMCPVCNAKNRAIMEEMKKKRGIA